MGRHNKIVHDSENQSGLASIIVTMIIMIVISLIVLSAAQLARRNQRQTLDRQLNTQAYYAAETGVNDAIKAINDELAVGGTNLTSTDRNDVCSGAGSFITAATLTQILDGDVSYSCLLVDPTPTTWEGNVDFNSKTTPIKDKNGANIDKIEIAWNDNNGNNDFSTCPSTTADLPAVDAWPCRTPVLKVDLVPTNTFTRNDLNTKVYSAFLFPYSGGVSTANYLAGGTEKILTKCDTNNTPKYCKLEFNNLGGASYYLRFKALYGTASITINGLDAGGNKIELKDSQIVIDSTGKASDILKRMQVRVPIRRVTDLPENAIQSFENICKLLYVDPANNSVESADPANCPIN